MKRGPARFALGSVLALVPACAQVKTTSNVKIVPRAGEAEVIGRPTGEVSDRAYEVWWLQRGREVIVELREHRRCQPLVHEPVVREEHVTRKLDGTIYWEFGVLAVTGGLATWAFIDPGTFGGVLINSQGEFVDNRAGGYRIAGVFAGIGVITLTAIIIDFMRARDTVTYADAYRVRPGAYTECETPTLPLEARSIRLRLGDAEVRETTDASGRARLTLPREIPFFDGVQDGGAPSDNVGRPSTDRRPAAVIVDEDHAVRIELRYPYPLAPASHVGRTPAAPFPEAPKLQLGEESSNENDEGETP